MTVPQKDKNRITIGLKNPTSGICPEELKARSQRAICTSMFRATLFLISQRWKQRMDKWNVVYTYAGKVFSLIRNFWHLTYTTILWLNWVPPKFLHWSPKPQDLRMWLYTEAGPLKKWFSYDESLAWVQIQSDWCPSKKRKFGLTRETTRMPMHREKTRWRGGKTEAICKLASKQTNLLTFWSWKSNLVRK